MSVFAAVPRAQQPLQPFSVQSIQEYGFAKAQKYAGTEVAGQRSWSSTAGQALEELKKTAGVACFGLISFLRILHLSYLRRHLHLARLARLASTLRFTN